MGAEKWRPVTLGDDIAVFIANSIIRANGLLRGCSNVYSYEILHNTLKTQETLIEHQITIDFDGKWIFDPQKKPDVETLVLLLCRHKEDDLFVLVGFFENGETAIEDSWLFSYNEDKNIYCQNELGELCSKYG